MRKMRLPLITWFQEYTTWYSSRECTFCKVVILKGQSSFYCRRKWSWKKGANYDERYHIYLCKQCATENGLKW